MTIGKKIKEARKRANLTQKQLADKLGVSQAMIAQYESGERKPKIETTLKIASALGVFSHQIDPELGEVMSFDSGAEFEKERAQITSGFHKESMNTLMDNLNIAGQNKALEQVELLTKIPEYRKDEE